MREKEEGRIGENIWNEGRMGERGGRKDRENIWKKGRKKI